MYFYPSPFVGAGGGGGSSPPPSQHACVSGISSKSCPSEHENNVMFKNNARDIIIIFFIFYNLKFDNSVPV